MKIGFHFEILDLVFVSHFVKFHPNYTKFQIFTMFILKYSAEITVQLNAFSTQTVIYYPNRNLAHSNLNSVLLHLRHVLNFHFHQMNIIQISLTLSPWSQCTLFLPYLQREV